MKLRITSHYLISLLFLFLYSSISFAQESGRTLDSLELVKFYESTCDPEKGCTLSWNFDTLINTWTGVSVSNDRVYSLNLQDKNLSDTIPPLELPNLRYLYLNNNMLSGSIPALELPNLRYLYLNSNILSGPVPSFTNSPDLRIINMYNNRLSGQIPDVNHLTQLRELYLGRNKLTGDIPDMTINSLIVLDIDLNELEGTIPNFNGIPNLQFLEIAFNRLTGPIPDLNHLVQLQYLSLGSNKLTGPIPNLDSLQNLEVLRLYDNDLSGPISDFNLPSIKEIALASNRLSGSIPDFSSTDNLEILSLNNNDLEGEIPDFTYMPMLIVLSLNGNKLTGGIPQFSNAPNLLILGLDDNNLTGNIPDFSMLSNIAFFRINNNKFSFDEIADYLPNNNALDFDYSPQRHDTIQSYIVTEGDTLTLSLSTPLPGNDNHNVVYQWRKNGEIVPDGIDSTYKINHLEISQLGKYTLHMTDTSRVNDLEIISEPIYVYSKGYDLYGQPVVYNQVMMEFDTWEDKVFYEEKYIGPDTETQGFVADSCSCNRLLYLWDFPNDTLALQVLLDVNDNIEKQADDGEIDGGLNNIFNVSPTVSGVGWTWSESYLENYPDSAIIYLLDSGIDTIHWDASDYLLDSAGVDACYNIESGSGYGYTNPTNSIDGDFTDSLGHGTYGIRSMTEGIPQYVNIKIVPLKVFDQTGQGTLFNFICGLYHAIDHGADIVNVSAGYAGEPSEILKNALTLAHQKQIFIITAAGNDGVNIDSIPQYPAYYSNDYYVTYEQNDQGNLVPKNVYYNNIISVASISSQDKLSDFSSYGKETVTMAAYGENMSGYSHTGNQVSSTGSSVSTYYVTRELAVEITKNRDRTLQEIWDTFESSRLRDCPEIAELTKTGKCLDISLNEIYGDFRVFLQGAYDSLSMKATLNTSRFLLPGQSAQDSAVIHPAPHPYDIPPFNYGGDEVVPDYLNNYPPYVVDWILVSLRTDKEKITEISRTAAWLTNTGKIQLLRPLLDETSSGYDSAYVVIEHRNHLGVMSPEKVSLEDGGLISWDFTKQNSYTNGTGTGQIELSSGVWAMLAGDGDQINDSAGYDITGSDKIIWTDFNGTFNQYISPDYNMDGDVNGGDKGLWYDNNGNFSDVPR